MSASAHRHFLEGPILFDGLRAAASPVVGDIRGKGLMIGVELVRPGTGSPGEPAVLQIALPRATTTSTAPT